MGDLEFVNARFNTFKVCIIIPTYNNANTLPAVIERVSEYTHNIILVNDGSTDSTEAIAKSFPFIDLINYTTNVGKGWALRKGFEQALALGYNYAITFNSDGQHLATDLPVFIKKLESVRDAIIIGSRNMEQTTVTDKSGFGHKLSNFWYWVETGIKCPDTQSGFRLYPLQLIKDIKFITRKYEFEIEVLVRASWHGLVVDSVIVNIHFAPKENNISYFRRFQDFLRISTLHTFLIIIAFTWIKPREFFKALFDKNKRRQLILDQILNIHQSDQIKAISVGVGVFTGVLPIWGFQMLFAIFLSIVFKLNKVLAAISSHISIPPMIPLIIFLSYKAGSFWMGSETININFGNASFKIVRQHLKQYVLGSITLALATGLLACIITFVLIKLLKRKTTTAD